MRRHVLGLFQKQVAKELDINEWTYLRWEKGQKWPPVIFRSRIIGFLGYDPIPNLQPSGTRCIGTLVAKVERGKGFGPR